MTWLRWNWEYLLELAATHVALCVPAIIVSVLVAVPIGRIATTRPRFGAPMLFAASLAYAVPALPLLIVVPLVLGIPLRSAATMIVALSVYGIALLVRSAADAFVSVDRIVHEAAVATGYSPVGIFWRVDLPLALPVLISGIRVVTVSTIALTTIGALIGVPSLGSALTDGFQRGIAGEVIVGVLATVTLAFVCDAIVVWIGRLCTPWTKVQP